MVHTLFIPPVVYISIGGKVFEHNCFSRDSQCKNKQYLKMFLYFKGISQLFFFNRTDHTASKTLCTSPQHHGLSRNTIIPVKFPRNCCITEDNYI